MALVHFQGDKDVEVSENRTLLSASLTAGIPHTNACGGKGKCSTCRVWVNEGLDHCSKRSENEAVIATTREFPDEVRLACQTTISGEISCKRLVLDEEDCDLVAEELHADHHSIGEERFLTFFFSDLRGFTTFTEKNIPYEVVHILNKYFHRVCPLIEKHGGEVDKFMGDGIMALFDHGNSNSTLNAIRSSLEQIKALEALNNDLKRYYGVELKLGIGLHYGEAIVGSVGYPGKFSFTAIGDAVNMTARIESANKEAGTELLISEDAYTQVKNDVVIGTTITLPLKGKSGTFNLYEVIGLKK